MTLQWSDRALDGLRRARTTPGGEPYDRLVGRLVRLEKDPATFDLLDGVTVSEAPIASDVGPLRAHVMEADVGHVFVLLYRIDLDSENDVWMVEVRYGR